jgi:hypothetical protein
MGQYRFCGGSVLRCNGGCGFGFVENFVLGPSGALPGLEPNNIRVGVAYNFSEYTLSIAKLYRNRLYLLIQSIVIVTVSELLLTA